MSRCSSLALIGRAGEGGKGKHALTLHTSQRKVSLRQGTRVFGGKVDKRIKLMGITSEAELEAFLKGKPRAWGEVIAARAALRVQPALNGLFDRQLKHDRPGQDIILQLWRAISLVLSVSFVPKKAEVFRSADAARASAFSSAISAARSAAFSATASNFSPVRSAAESAARSVLAASSVASANFSAAAADAANSSTSAAYSAAFFSAAPASAAAASAARSAAFSIITADANWLLAGESPQALASSPLGAILVDWSAVAGPGASTRNLPPDDLFAPQWAELRQNLIAHNGNWMVWIEWYEAVRDGKAPWGLPRDASNSVMLEALKWPESEWEQGPKHINAQMWALVNDARGREWDRFSPSIDDVITAASPNPFVNAEGKLDVGPNQSYDRPEVTSELYELPNQQISVIDALLDAMPGNAPRILTASLEIYKKHLRKRKYQPHLGTLKDHAAIVLAELNSRDADDWRRDGHKVGFRRFEDNHNTFVAHFPLDPKRDEIYAAINVDESKFDDPELAKGYDAFAKAADEAFGAGIVTEEFADTVRDDASFAKALSSTHYRDLVIGRDDRPAPPVISAKKRFALNKFAFVSRISTIASGITIAKDGPEAWANLVALAKKLKEWFLNFIM